MTEHSKQFVRGKHGNNSLCNQATVTYLFYRRKRKKKRLQLLDQNAEGAHEVRAQIATHPN
jgi:hypothetical protein